MPTIKSLNAAKEWAELRDIFSPRDLRSVLRRAAARTGSEVRALAVGNLQSSPLANAPAMRRGVRIYGLRRSPGSFQLTLHPHGRRGVGYTSRHNRGAGPKPVLLFAEEGTRPRRTRRGGRRGSMPAYNHLRGVEERGTKIIETDYAATLERAVEQKRKKLGWE